MLFNSFEYLLLFLPVTFIVFRLLSRAASTERQIIWLTFASLVFYASWEPVYLLLIATSIAVNFALGRLLARGNPRYIRAWLLTGICFNLGLLGYFKYTGFFLEGLNALGLWLIPIPEITLPLAISFFSFQQIAYLVDVSRGECREYQFHHYALFVLFFPQLISGPIVHHREMMPQFNTLRQRSQLSTDFAVGLSFIAMGLFKKVILADSLALIVDPVFGAATLGEQVSRTDALLGTYAFSFQIYFDFSGYSDIAIGSARLFGIKLPENFRSPYKSSNNIQVWQRWHMTLSRFLRDYLYIPLGGNRHGSFERYRNLMITMLLGGLWHGAAWTFVAWGGIHGLYLCVNHGWRGLLRRRMGLQAFFGHRVFLPLFVLLTFTAWTIALTVFRADDIESAWLLIDIAFLDQSMQVAPLLSEAFADSFARKLLLAIGMDPAAYTEIYLLMFASAFICWALPNSQQFMGDYDPVVVTDRSPVPPARFRWSFGAPFAVLTASLLSVSLLSLTSVNRFYYFQF